MKIIDVFWKCRRVIRRNRETISRVIGACIGLALLVCVAFYAVGIYKADLAREEQNALMKDKSPIASSRQKDYGAAGFNKVAENSILVLDADFTTGEIRVTEKSSGKVWYSNPQDRENDNYCVVKPTLSSQLMVEFMDITNSMISEANNFMASVRKGWMDHELVENGIKFKFTFPAQGVVIPVQYTLSDDGFLAEIVSSEIEELWSEKYLVTKIKLLPFFGAGGLEDNGYVFIPDGSGALIDYNNNKQNAYSYSQPVFGRNITLELSEDETPRERITLPVFGAKCNDNAFLSVITSGDVAGVISASTSKKTSSYNQVYAEYKVREFQTSSHYRAETGKTHRYSELTDVQLGDKNFTVKYFFLEKERANYVGMAERYKEYLQEQNALTKSNLANKNYLILDVYGAVSIEKYVLGVKRPVVTALTTYNEVCDIVKELKQQGVDNLIINYIGALNDGLNNKLNNKVSIERKLGTKKEFQAMIDYLAKENVVLFIETNPVDFYNTGNGYTLNRDGARGFFNKYAFQYKYNLDSLVAQKDSRWHILRPQLVPDLVGGFVDSAADWNIKNISFARLGENLYTDFSKNEYYSTLIQTKDLWNQTLKHTSEKAEYLMVHGGNAYCSAFADVITDVSSSNSGFDMEDHSIPFYHMVFGSTTVLAPSAINDTVDYEYAFLKALEAGTSLKYNVFCGDASMLVGTAYNDMVSYSYDYWKDIAVAQYHEMQEATQEFGGEQIVDHELLAEGVNKTVFESKTIIVNSSDAAYTYCGIEIAARDYLVLPGGAK